MTSFFDLAGIPGKQIEGGHKQFRNHVLSYFDAAAWGRLLVLRGLTGVGKPLKPRSYAYNSPFLEKTNSSI